MAEIEILFTVYVSWLRVFDKRTFVYYVRFWCTHIWRHFFCAAINSLCVHLRYCSRLVSRLVCHLLFKKGSFPPPHRLVSNIVSIRSKASYTRMSASRFGLESTFSQSPAPSPPPPISQQWTRMAAYCSISMSGVLPSW